VAFAPQASVPFAGSPFTMTNAMPDVSKVVPAMVIVGVWVVFGAGGVMVRVVFEFIPSNHSPGYSLNENSMSPYTSFLCPKATSVTVLLVSSTLYMSLYFPFTRSDL